MVGETFAATIVVKIGAKAIDCICAQLVVPERKLIGDRRRERALKLMDSEVVLTFDDQRTRTAVLDELER
jgi:poly(A) polymerase Pap1